MTQGVCKGGVKKVCSRCGVEKPLRDFNKNSKAKDGRQWHCRECSRVMGRDWLAANPEKNREKQRRWRAANPEREAESRRRWKAANPEKIKGGTRRYKLKRAYGLTVADYDTLLQSQGGGCAFCGKTPMEEGRFLAVDHDHQSGKIRGILCDRCNRGLGYFDDNASLLRRAIDYLVGVE